MIDRNVLCAIEQCKGHR